MKEHKIATPAKITILQLNVSASTGVSFGHRDQKNAKMAYATPNALTGTPHLPRDQRAWGRSSG